MFDTSFMIFKCFNEKLMLQKKNKKNITTI